MVKQLFLIFSFILLISSCAQVGRLSGGDQDVSPPRVTKSSPENETVNFKGNSFSITFDEYIKLNNPSENIRIVPPHVKPFASIKKKTLDISWDGDLEPNTTYALYLNKAVKDIAEGNDSVMQFVFSTGSFIDTLSYTCVLHDAFTGRPLKDHLVGAYRVSDTSLLNIAQSDMNGVATMSYLSPGEYRFIAFNDLNNDLKPQLSEPIAFKEEKTMFSVTISDSLPYRIFQPVAKPGINKKAVLSSSKAAISFRHEIDSTTLKVTDVESSRVLSYRQTGLDSIQVYFKDTVAWRSKKIAFEDDQFVDTISLLNRAGRSRLQVNLLNTNVLPDEPLILEANQLISSFNDSLIRLSLKDDSSRIQLTDIVLDHDRVFIYIADGFNGDAVLDMRAGTFTSLMGINSARTAQINLLEERDLTVLEADISSYSAPLLITCFKDGEEIRTERADGEQKIRIASLIPGEYTFRIILDENNNGKWDTGDFSRQLHPETVHYFSEPIRLRPNWESTITFTPDE